MVHIKFKNLNSKFYLPQTAKRVDQDDNIDTTTRSDLFSGFLIS